MKRFVYIAVLVPLLAAAGCAPVVVGAGATAAYKVGTDERSTGKIWDDSAITARVKKEMIKAPDVNAARIDVDTVEGTVHLTGVVGTKEEAERAEKIARSVPNVRQVKNNLQVGEKTFGQALDDKILTSKIKTKLIGEPGIRSLNIDVDVNLGVVTLTGVVKDAEQKKRIVEIAADTPGTVKVTDHLRVSGQ